MQLSLPGQWAAGPAHHRLRKHSALPQPSPQPLACPLQPCITSPAAFQHKRPCAAVHRPRRGRVTAGVGRTALGARTCVRPCCCAAEGAAEPASSSNQGGEHTNEEHSGTTPQQEYVVVNTYHLVDVAEPQKVKVAFAARLPHP